MKWSLRVGRLFGIPLYVHFTFFLFLMWVAAESWRMGGSTGGALVEVLFMCALFGCVVLHELGHALTARRYGIATRDITLLPIGGVARPSPGPPLTFSLPASSCSSPSSPRAFSPSVMPAWKA